MSLSHGKGSKNLTASFSDEKTILTKQMSRGSSMKKQKPSGIESIKEIIETRIGTSHGAAGRAESLTKNLMKRLSASRIEEADRASKLRQLAGSVAVNIVRPQLRSFAKSLALHTPMVPGKHMRATISKGVHTQGHHEQPQGAVAVAKHPVRPESKQRPPSTQQSEEPYVPRHRGRPPPVLGAMKTKSLHSYKAKDQELRARLTPRDKAILTTLGAKRAAARGAQNTLVSLCAMKGEEQDEGVTHATRRNIVAIEKLRGHVYIEEKDKRMAEMEEDAIKALEAERDERAGVDVIGLTARLANFGGGFYPEICGYRPKFDPDRAKAEKKIAERFAGKELRSDKEEVEVCTPIWDTWDARMRGELRAGMTAREQKHLLHMEKKMKELERQKTKAAAADGRGGEEKKVDEESDKSTITPMDICPKLLCDRAPCREPEGLPPVYQRTMPEFPQFNSCTLLGNWVEERRKYVRKTHCPFSIYNFDYRRPCPPVPYSKHPYYANMFSHRGLPYDVLFTHGSLPPPRKWTQVCKRPPCAPCCQPISCVTESRANYRPPPQGSYVVCRRATPKALSSSYERISRNIWNWHLRGEQLRMVPTPCG